MNISLWNHISSLLEQEILPLNFSLFLSDVVVSGDGDELILSCPNEFVLEQVRSNYEERIRELARQISGREIAVRVTSGPQIATPPVRLMPATPAGESLSPPDPSTFLLNAEVVEGPENLFAWQALRQAIAFPGRYNPLFVYGKTGVGKSRYLQTIASAYEKRGRKVLLLRGFEFMNQYMMAVQKNAYEAFYQHFRGLDLLCIDDVHYLEGKDRTQETFTNIFNGLFDSGAQIVLSADRPPNAITGMMEALVSRLTWGLILEIAPPSETTRRRLVERWSAHAQPLPAAVVERLVAHPFASVRAFEGVLTRLWAQTEIFGRPVGLREVQEELERTGEDAAPLGLSEIERLVCDHYNLSSRELTGKDRSLRVARPRQLAMYLAKKHGSSSYPVIGEFFGLKSHSSVISACRRIEKLRRSDRQLSLDLDEIEKNLK
ncbi:ATP-binding protein [Myxococcota bacterium]|nr:ATP-binding protein [Myxococcota bacterium]